MPHRYINIVIRKVKYLTRLITVKESALDARPRAIQGANRKYQKFVIFTHPRSGSTMLKKALKTHPQVFVFGELFRTSDIGFFADGFDNQSIELLAARNKYPIEFLNRSVFANYRDDIKAVGFKLHGEHLDYPRFRCVWDWLEKQSDLKIIHLKRRDLLAAYTSLKVAKTDRRFGIQDESERTKTTVSIDPKECLETFQMLTQQDKKIKNRIKNQEVMECAYEELAADSYGCLKNIQEFLGVDVYDLKVRSVKQEIRPLPDVIDNYDELRTEFQGTEWEYLFNHQPVAERNPS